MNGTKQWETQEKRVGFSKHVEILETMALFEMLQTTYSLWQF